MNTTQDNEVYNVSEPQNFEEQESSCNSSCDSSCCSFHSDGSIPEWNDSVLENGELFFIKCSPFIDTSSNTDLKTNVPFTKRSRLPKFLKRKKFNKQKTLNITKNQKFSGLDEAKIEGSSSNFNDVGENLVSVLYINLATIDRDESTTDNIIYTFPQVTDKNVVYSIRGALLTLYHLLPKLVLEVPESTTLLVNDELLHLVYIGVGKELMIVALPENKCSLFDLKLLTSCITRYLNFKYKSLHECFRNPLHHPNLNQFFGNFFVKLFRSMDQSMLSRSNPDLRVRESCNQFEESFGFPCKLAIPHNLEMKIEEKLNEIEANDFGDLSEDHYGCQRLYTITGTCLYQKGYLVASHLNKEDQLDVHAFLRLNDLLDLTVTSVIESLVIWQEIYMSSCCYSTEGLRTFPANRRWFLLIIGQDQSLFVTLLESGGCSVKVEGALKPDELYVDQIQETLDDIIHYGLADAVEQILKTPEESTLQKNSFQKSSENLLGINNSSNLAKSSSILSCESETPFFHSSPTLSNGNYDDTYSDSLSRTASSIFSDEVAPVLGRRAQRMKQLSNSGSIYPLYSNLSDSDRSDLDTTGSSHSSSFAEVGKKPIKENISNRIIHGDGQALFHYVNLQAHKGVIVSSLKGVNSQFSAKYYGIMNNFRLTAQKIHRILSEKKTSVIGKHHRNSLPVKEYGILYEYEGDDDSKKESTVYWVVGRAFNKGNLGEVYVCYEDRTPQNLVEIAFRLAMVS